MIYSLGYDSKEKIVEKKKENDDQGIFSQGRIKGAG